jgi:hypothetical protein
MIDIPVAALYTPLLLLGYSGGVFINLLLASGTRLLLLATLLTIMVVFTVQRGLTLLRVELDANSESSSPGTGSPLPPSKHTHTHTHTHTHAHTHSKIEKPMETSPHKLTSTNAHIYAQVQTPPTHK